MRLLVTLVLVLIALPARGAAPAPAAAPTTAQPHGPDVDVIVPIDPHEHERVHWFGRRDHHLVPGTVTIDREPYRCDVDGSRFRKEDEFVAHLRTAHRIPPERIPDALVVRGGLVHFIGEPAREGRRPAGEPRP